VEFEGPTFQCNSTASNTTSERRISNSQDTDPYYTASWGSYNKPHAVYESLSMNLTRAVGYYPGFYLLEEFHLQCRPARGRYIVDLEYEDGLRTFSHQVNDIKTLHDTFVGGVVPDMGVEPDFKPNTSIPWTQEMIGNLRNINNYAVLDTVVSTLAGSYDQVMLSKPGPRFPSELPNGTSVEFRPAGASFTFNDQGLMIEGSSWEIRRSKNQSSRQSYVG
jgi:hypothetical protein